MNEAQFLLSIGMKPRELFREGLCAPSLKWLDRGLSEMMVKDLDGTIMVPSGNLKKCI